MPMVWLMCGFAYDSGGKWLEKDFVVAVISTYPFWIFPLNFIVLLVYRIVRVKYIAWLAYLLPIPFTYAGLDYIGSHVFGSDCYNPNDPRIFYYTPAKDIVDAMMKEDTLTVKKILQVSPQLAYYVEEYHKESLFFFAFWHGKYASVRTMIRMGVSPDICDARDKVLLEHLVTDSVSEKNIYMIKWLIDNGADVNVNARDYAEAKSYTGEGITPLQTLCIMGEDSPELAALLVEHGAEVNVARRRDNEVITALEDAAYFHKYKLVIYLLQHGARRSLRARDYLNHPDEVTPTVLKAWKLINGEPIDSMEEK